MIVAIDRARLHRPVWPGDRLLIAAAVVSRFGRLIKVRSEATLDGGESPPPLMSEGEFTLAAGGPGEEGA